MTLPLKNDIRAQVTDDTTPLMVRMTSFEPAPRPGYGDRVKREKNLSARISARLYGAREKITRSILRYADDGKPWDESCIQALVDNGISPRSVDGWVDYMHFLVINEGGWKGFVTRLRHEYSFTQAYRAAYRQATFHGVLWSLVSIIVFIMVVTTWTIALYPIIVVVPPVAYLAAANTILKNNKKADCGDYIGPTKRHDTIPRWPAVKSALNL